MNKDDVDASETLLNSWPTTGGGAPVLIDDCPIFYQYPTPSLFCLDCIGSTPLTRETISNN